MKKLKYQTDKESSDYMAGRCRQNKVRCLSSKAETWALAMLSRTGRKWTRQAMWGFRIFDFWNAEIGCAIEIDGPEHNAEIDRYRDEYNFRRSGIVVLRVKNFDVADMNAAIRNIHDLGGWQERRASLGFTEAKRSRHVLAAQPYDANRRMLDGYLENGSIPHPPQTTLFN